jgi:tubulin-specific chaperone A
MADLKRQLKIKTGVVRRLIKEYSLYERELEVQEKRLEALEDAYERGRQMTFVAESRSMLPNTKKRLADAANDLNVFVQANVSREELTSTEDWTLALEQVQEALNSVINSA